MRRQLVNCGFQSWKAKWRYASFETKYLDNHTIPTTIEKNDAIAAPATPNAWPVPHPKIRNGATSMLSETLTVDTSMPGLKLPTARSAAPIAPRGNCSAIAGMNHNR